jgi:uncharacterized protein (TIGR03000 family)
MRLWTKQLHEGRPPALPDADEGESMSLFNRSKKSISTLLVTAVVIGIGSVDANAAGPEGHGGGAGHLGGGFVHGGYGGYGHGGYGGYGYGGRGYGYGWGGFGWGLGLGLGVGFYGYPYYGYGGYPYGPYAYGYPYAYGSPYPYPPYPGVAGSPPNPAMPGVPVAPAGGPYATPAGAIPSPPGPLPVADVTLDIRTPADASVWINGIKTNQTGPSREFVSSGLDAGRKYTFDIRAQWTTADGKPVDTNRHVHVQAGERCTIDLTTPSP